MQETYRLNAEEEILLENLPSQIFLNYKFSDWNGIKNLTSRDKNWSKRSVDNYDILSFKMSLWSSRRLENC